SISVWDVQNHKTLFKEFLGHAKPVSQVKTCCKDTQLISWANDRTLRLWDIDFSHSLVYQPHHIYTKLLFSLNGESIQNVNFYIQSDAKMCGTLTPDGWLVYKDQLYLWIPAYYRISLQSPQLISLPPTGINSSVSINWSSFVHGSQWTSI
ncbi:hypothetical protein BDN72DRAFT_737734, partial [Pluteus cervinus]